MVALIKTQKLYKAVRGDDWNTAVSLVAGGAKPNLKTIHYIDNINDNGYREWTALMRVALGAVHDDKTAKDKLFYAAVKADSDEAARLFAAGTVPDDTTMNFVVRRLGIGWLLDMTNALAKAGKKPSSEALQIAFAQRSEAKADILIAAGAVPDEKTLKDAAYCWTVEAVWVKKLIDAGAPVTSAALRESMAFLDPLKISALLEGGVVPDEETMAYAFCRLDDMGMAETLFDRMIQSGGKATPTIIDAVAWRFRNDGGKWEEMLEKVVASRQMTPSYNKAAAKKPAKVPRLVMGKKPKLVLGSVALQKRNTL